MMERNMDSDLWSPQHSTVDNKVGTEAYPYLSSVHSK